jgi:hypothetical protein
VKNEIKSRCAKAFLPKIDMTYRCLCIIALKAKPSLQLVVKFLTLTLGYPAVFI